MSSCNLRLQMAVTSIFASLNPAIVARQNTGIDSEEASTSCLSTSNVSASQHFSTFLRANSHQRLCKFQKMQLPYIGTVLL